MVASDGGIFSFGDARFYGSTGGMRLNRPIVGMAATPTRHAATGWSPATAASSASATRRFFGSTGGIRLNRPIVDMASARRRPAATCSPPRTAACSSSAPRSSTARPPPRARPHSRPVSRCRTHVARLLDHVRRRADVRVLAVERRRRAVRRASTRTRPRVTSSTASTPNAPHAAAPRSSWDRRSPTTPSSWSQNMAANGFRHSNIAQHVGHRLATTSIGENIAMGYGSGTTAGTLHVAWMNSSGHRAEHALAAVRQRRHRRVLRRATVRCGRRRRSRTAPRPGRRPAGPCRRSIRSSAGTAAVRAADPRTLGSVDIAGALCEVLRCGTSGASSSGALQCVETMGLEPTTPCLQSRCSSQLSYVPGAVQASARSPVRVHQLGFGRPGGAPDPRHWRPWLTPAPTSTRSKTSHRRATGASSACAWATRWVHLRRCTECGHIGCCDNSPERHATKHFHEIAHPIIQSFEPGEDWYWCYVDEIMFEADGEGPSPSHT